jgi:hypothetical protein
MGMGRTIFGIFLILLIIAAVIFTYVNRDVLFINEVQIKYPDGCVEKYVNTKMTTPECVEGRRMLAEQHKDPDLPPGMIEFPIGNITGNFTEITEKISPINITHADSNYTPNASEA